MAITLPGIGTEISPPTTNFRKIQEPTRIMRHIVKSEGLFIFLNFLAVRSDGFRV